MATSKHLPSGGIEAQLDVQLALLTSGVRDALGRAAQMPLQRDDWFDARAREFSSAAGLARASGDLVLAMARLNGRFNHDINVRRVSGETPPPPPED